MSKQTFNRPGGPRIGKKILLQLEGCLGMELTSSYRDFLARQNGGVPINAFFWLKTREGKYKSWVDFFCQVDPENLAPCEDAPVETLAFQNAIHSELIPENSLIIGIAARDNLLLLRCKGSNRGQVDIKIMSELGAPLADSNWGADREQGVYNLAKSFDDFVDSLGPDDEVTVQETM